MFILYIGHIKYRHLRIYYGFSIAVNAVNHFSLCLYNVQQILCLGFQVVDPFIICNHYKTSGKRCLRNEYLLANVYCFWVIFI